MVNAEIFDNTLKLYGLQKKEFAQHAKIPYDTVVGWKRRGEVPEFAFMLLKKICNDLRLKRQTFIKTNEKLKLNNYHGRIIRAIFWGKNYTMEDIYRGIDENDERFTIPLLKNLYAGDIRMLFGKNLLKKMVRKNKKLLAEDNYKTLMMVAK